MGAVLAAGRELDVRVAVPVPDFESYTFPAPADVSLIARRVSRALDLKGTVDVTATGTCARCLDDVTLPLHLELDECLDPESDRDDPLGESNVLVGGELDLADLVRQLIDSALPLVLHCTDDCGGLCPTCGNQRNGTCRCPPGVIDG